MRPLHHACREGHGELAALLLRKGADAGAVAKVCRGVGGAQCTAARSLSL